MSTDQQILTQLEAMQRQLDAIEARQRFTEELVRDMTPIARMAMTSAAEKLAVWDDKGLFAMLRVTRDAFERVLDSYTEEDARHLAENVGERGRLPCLDLLGRDLRDRDAALALGRGLPARGDEDRVVIGGGRDGEGDEQGGRERGGRTGHDGVPSLPGRT